MNNTLILKGKLQTRRAQRPGAPALPVGKSVDMNDMEAKIASLQTVRDYWREQPPISIKRIITPCDAPDIVERFTVLKPAVLGVTD